MERPERLRLSRDDEEGFTLIELMVVVLIIAILIAIAIPTFLGARQRANDRAAQTSLRHALTAAKILYTDTQDYTGATPPGLTGIVPSLTYTAAASTGFKGVSVIAAPTGQSWWAVVRSNSGTCFGLEDNSGPAGAGVTYAGTTTPLPSPCAAPATDPGWTDTHW
jgi:type IV pilus assembly protein PilA